MKRAALAFALLLMPSLAGADLVATPPSIQITGHDRAITTSGPPNRVSFTIRNVVSNRDTEVYLHRLIVIDDGMRLPIDIDHVEINGRRLSRRIIRVPGGRSRRVDIVFTLPERQRNGDRWVFELATTSDRGNARGRATIHRGHRTPARATASLD